MPLSFSKSSKSGGDRRKNPLPILILEDERFDRHRLTRLCSTLEEPYHIDTAATLQEFGRCIDAHSYSLILLDYTLPDGTGIDAVKLVRSSSHNMTAPTLMISGTSNQALPEQAASAGCTGYLSKDALTTNTFHLAVSEVFKNQAEMSLTKSQFDQAEMAALLVQATRRQAGKIKPGLTQILRYAIALSAPTTEAEAEVRRALEQECTRLIELTADMERADGASMLHQIANDCAELDPKSTLKQRKPPSPFGRATH
ncbi:MAG: response regulator [Pseudomonadota bacterium]